MTPVPSGRWSPTNRHELLFARSFRAPIDDVWASITESDRTALWFASWSGDAGPGRTIRYLMMFEDDAPEADMVIEACEPPRRLVVTAIDESGNWRLEARLNETDGVTELTLVHHVDDEIAVGEVGPAQKDYFEALDRT